ncbi:lytic murein transglycosylase [Rhodomicrobium lacus]|uniref:lytic murein transglycosylase n=1 Tax=Rhodomicrobium lacus TaxID=2498452 RepID=UPI0026E2A680|nr:lytic murein transglycosylase [Rhodomicrobium lacus]WKW51551.1 lytic murein transglycosylase [Rhodomicrobium lacus]
MHRVAARLAAALIAMMTLAGFGSARAEESQDTAFGALKSELWPLAEREGIARDTFDAAFAGLEPDPEVLRLANRQPEFTLTATQYLDRIITPARIADGKAAYLKYEGKLKVLERRYGVSRFILVAIWGAESDFGNKQGSWAVFRSLATLAAAGRRADFWKTQIVEALKIVENQRISPDKLSGSWAGAMGHTQFIPSTYNKFGISFSGRPRSDIWDDPADAMASTANYLAQSGWQRRRTWGYAVRLPDGFAPTDAQEAKPIASWRKLGVARETGEPFPKPGETARLFLPEKTDPFTGEKANTLAFLTVANFDVIKTYNNSDLYALAVGLLADRLAAELSSR